MMTNEAINQIKAIIEEIDQKEAEFVEHITPNEDRGPLTIEAYKVRLDFLNRERELLEWDILDIVMKQLK